MKTKLILLILTVVLLYNCLSRDTKEDSYRYQLPEQKNDGWPVSSLDAEGIDTAKIEEFIEKARNRDFNWVHTVHIARNGKLVLEAFLYRSFINQLHEIQSCTKSVTSTLIGIAIDKGMILSVDVPFFDFFPDYMHLCDEEKKKIKLYHTLTMSMGLEWNEGDIPPYDPDNDHYIVRYGGNFLRHLLGKPLIYEPGTFWYYNSGGSMALGAIIYRVSGLHADRFAKKYLFDPLGIDDYDWWYIDEGYPHTGGGLSMHQRDMAKLGQLYLDNGMWQGQRILSEQWAKNATRNRIGSRIEGRDTGYGYQWWTYTFSIGGNKIDSFFAAGAGGQYIFVVRSLSLVVVFTQGDHFSETKTFEMMEGYILPAVK